MTDQNAERLETEADDIRRGIAHTAEEIQDRMSPGKMIDEFMTYMKRSDGALALSNLQKQARVNPMAVAVIGSGVAWLMFGSGENGASTGGKASARPNGDASSGSSLWPTSHERDGGASSRGASEMRDKLGEGMEATAGKARELADQARGAADQAADGARAMAGDVADRTHAAADTVRDMAARGRRSVMEAVDREPLVIGAIGVAVGAAIGAMLPGTRFEDEAVGETRDALLRDADHAVEHAVEAAREAGGEALEAAKSAVKEPVEGP